MAATEAVDNGECLTFGELISLAVYSAPAEYYEYMAKYENVIARLREADAPVDKFSDFIDTYTSVKTKMYRYLTELEIRLLNDNDAYIKNFIFSLYTQHFT